MLKSIVIPSRRLCLAFLILSTAIRAETADASWQGGDGNWKEATRWSPAPPAPATNADIQSGAPVVDSPAKIRSLRVGSEVRASASLTIQTGADLTVGAGTISLVGTGGDAWGLVEQKNGNASFGLDLVLGGNGAENIGGGAGTYLMSGGRLSIARALLLGKNLVGSSNSRFVMSGGVVTAGRTEVGAARYLGGQPGRMNTAKLELSGGAFSVVGDLIQGVATANGQGKIESSIEIIGSKAAISVGGDVVFNDNARSTAALRCLVDDEGLATIRVSGGGKVSLAGELSAAPLGGLAFVAKQVFTIVEAPKGGIEQSFRSLPAAELWDMTKTDLESAREALQLVVRSTAVRGMIDRDVAAKRRLEFPPTTKGCVAVENLRGARPPMLRIRVQPGSRRTVAEWGAHLREAGIGATVDSADPRHVKVTPKATVGTRYLIWDLADFATDATIDSIEILD